MTRRSNGMTPAEFVHVVGGIGLWLLGAVLIVLAMATLLETLAGY